MATSAFSVAAVMNFVATTSATRSFLASHLLTFLRCAKGATKGSTTTVDSSFLVAFPCSTPTGLDGKDLKHGFFRNESFKD